MIRSESKSKTGITASIILMIILALLVLFFLKSSSAYAQSELEIRVIEQYYDAQKRAVIAGPGETIKMKPIRMETIGNTVTPVHVITSNVTWWAEISGGSFRENINFMSYTTPYSHNWEEIIIGVSDSRYNLSGWLRIINSDYYQSGQYQEVDYYDYEFTDGIPQNANVYEAVRYLPVETYDSYRFYILPEGYVPYTGVFVQRPTHIRYIPVRRYAFDWVVAYTDCVVIPHPRYPGRWMLWVDPVYFTPGFNIHVHIGGFHLNLNYYYDTSFVYFQHYNYRYAHIYDWAYARGFWDGVRYANLWNCYTVVPRRSFLHHPIGRSRIRNFAHHSIASSVRGKTPIRDFRREAIRSAIGKEPQIFRDKKEIRGAIAQNLRPINRDDMSPRDTRVGRGDGRRQEGSTIDNRRGSGVTRGTKTPNRPDQNVRPGGQIRPDRPDQRVRPNNPATPSRPAQNVRPNNPATPSRPPQSVRPNNPATPSRPAQNVRPNKPATPSRPPQNVGSGKTTAPSRPSPSVNRGNSEGKPSQSAPKSSDSAQKRSGPAGKRK